MERIFNIAIDGPSGAGKSSVAKALAKELGIKYLDTGAMYRAVGLKCIRAGVNPRDAHSVKELMAATRVDIQYRDGVQTVLLDGEDVSFAIRENAVSRAASDASAVPEVRIILAQMQRDIAKKESVVLDGRDIGTYVLPDAEFKFYLTADRITRAERRRLELLGKGTDIPLEQLVREIAERDENDSSREFAPLMQAENAVLIDSTRLSLEEVVTKILSILTASLENAKM